MTPASSALVQSVQGIMSMTHNPVVLVKAGNERWLWGPYGNLATCIDPEQYGTINSGTLPVPDRFSSPSLDYVCRLPQP